MSPSAVAGVVVDPGCVWRCLSYRPFGHAAAIASFEPGETLLLSNGDVFSEGFDVPAIEAVLMLRPTRSLGLYLQMAGRALRPAANKQHAVIIDMVGNYTRHGLVEDDRNWSLDAPPGRPEHH